MKYALRARIKNKARRTLFKGAGLDPQVNHHLDSMLAEPRRDVDRVALYSPQLDVTAPSLVHEEDVVTYSYPRRYVYRIPLASIDPLNGLIYDKDGKLIAESTSWPIGRLLYEVTQPYVRPSGRVHSGEYVFFGANRNYYHWVIEDLPVFLAARESAPSAKVLVPAGNFSLSQDFLTRYIGGEQVEFNGLIRVESLVVCGKTSSLGSPYHHNVVHPHDVATVRKWVSENIRPLPAASTTGRDVYVSRAGLRRSYAGEAEVEAILRERGFEIFRGLPTLEEQVDYFADVRRLVGASGAGLVNLMWMPSDGSLTYLLDSEARFGFYPHLAHALGLGTQNLKIEGASAASVADAIAVR